jgi:hypothetical protein
LTHKRHQRLLTVTGSKLFDLNKFDLLNRLQQEPLQIHEKEQAQPTHYVAKGTTQKG